MPFTFAHPAAVLPIHSRYRRWFSLPALVVGSVVPDAAYYLPMPENYKQNAHTWVGAFSFSLPVGLVVLLIFYWLAAEVIYLLPSPHREALQGELKPPRLSLRTILLAACGIVIGAETHVAWDGFTHVNGWAVELISWLRYPLWHERAPVYFALEVGFTLLGLYVLFYVYDLWMRAKGLDPWAWQRPSWRLYFWLAVVAGCFTASLIESHTIEALITYNFLRGRHFALVFATSFIRDVLAAVIAVALAIKILSPASLRRTAY